MTIKQSTERDGVLGLSGSKGQARKSAVKYKDRTSEKTERKNDEGLYGYAMNHQHSGPNIVQKHSKRRCQTLLNCNCDCP